MAERGSTAALHHRVHGAQDLESMVAQGFVKQGFKVLLHCSRWPIASFILSGFTNPMHLHAVYPCILGLSTGGSLELGTLHTWGALFRESTSHQPRVLIGY